MTRWTVDPVDPEPSALREVATVLESGGVVVVPTETFYGLAADVRCAGAVRRVVELKGRAGGKPLLLLVDGLDRARQVAPEAPDALDELARDFWPGPLTLILPAPHGLSPEITAGTSTVALRHCANTVASLLVSTLGAPITGTSANRSGDPPARHAGDVRLAAGHQPDGIVDAGATPGGLASTLLDLTRRPFRVLREGPISRADLQRSLGTRLL